MTDTVSQLSVRVPSHEEAAVSQDTEWCEVAVDGETHRVRFHDYHEIYDVPGLSERIFHDHLKCRSPEVVIVAVDILPEAARAAEPLEYVALVGRQRADVPDVWT